MAINLAVKREVAGLILQSPLTSAIEVAIKKWKWFPFSICDIFVSINKISYVEMPIFIIHGKLDSIVPFNHSLRLAKRSKNVWKLLELEEGNHNNIERLYKKELVSEIIKFVEYLKMKNI